MTQMHTYVMSDVHACIYGRIIEESGMTNECSEVGERKSNIPQRDRLLRVKESHTFLIFIPNIFFGRVIPHVLLNIPSLWCSLFSVSLLVGLVSVTLHWLMSMPSDQVKNVVMP